MGFGSAWASVSARVSSPSPYGCRCEFSLPSPVCEGGNHPRWWLVVPGYRLGRQRRICVPDVVLMASGGGFCCPLPGVPRGQPMRVQCSSFCLLACGGQRFLWLFQCLAPQSNREDGFAEAPMAGCGRRFLRCRLCSGEVEGLLCVFSSSTVFVG
jgi:hypothetical protein